jgi:hypothetical protein
MSRPIGDISAVLVPAVELQASDAEDEDVTELLHDSTFEDAEAEADPPEGFVC